MPKNYPELEEVRRVRRETLELLSGLTQEQLGFVPAPGRWAVGTVADHLVKADEVFVGEVRTLVERQRAGKAGFLYRGLAGADPSLPASLKLVLPFFEVPMTLATVLIPDSVRRVVFSARAVPAKSPKFLKPRPGRPGEDLRRELGKLLADLDDIEAGSADLRQLCYYNPIVGLTDGVGILRFLSSHERRHQGQMRDVLASTKLPRAA